MEGVFGQPLVYDRTTIKRICLLTRADAARLCTMGWQLLESFA